MRVDGERSTSPNVRLLCAVHNRLAARERLGDRLMDRFCHNPRQGEVCGNPNPNLNLNPCGPAPGPAPSSPGP
jgi:hypothetical protein